MNASGPAVPQVSLEFFPPDSEQGRQNLLRVAGKLAPLAPEYCSVTYGAGGSTRDRTMQTVKLLMSESCSVVPHLSFGQDSETAIRAQLDDYHRLGVRRLLVIGGDVPAQLTGSVQRKALHAIDLIRFIRRNYRDAFRLSVAAYPEVHPKADSAASDLHWLKEKVQAGADRVVTQYFYNADAYEDFLDRMQQADIKVPVYPGIMPIYNYQGAVNFAQKCGAEIPRWILMRMRQYQDDQSSLRAFGVEVVTALCEKLLNLSAPGLHFYTLNQSKSVLVVCRQLGLCSA